jgi:predicted transcriptional regulator
MLSVLISINPGWCQLIESGKKKIEVRKTRPKHSDIFKVYIYETKTSGYIPQFLDTSKYDVSTGRGAVIGEFFCNRVVPIKVEYSNPKSPIADAVFPFTEMTDREIINYLGNGKTGYGWNITGLKIYDCPKDIREFRKPCIKHKDDCGLCKAHDPWSDTCMKQLLSPPQSWCYVEDLEQEYTDD